MKYVLKKYKLLLISILYSLIWTRGKLGEHESSSTTRVFSQLLKYKMEKRFIFPL